MTPEKETPTSKTVEELIEQLFQYYDDIDCAVTVDQRITAKEQAELWLKRTLTAQKQAAEAELLATIIALQQSMDDAPISFPPDIDITEVPDGLAHELRGMKKGWHAALEQLKQQTIAAKHGITNL